MTAGGLAALAAVYVLVGDRTVWGEALTIWPPVLWVALLAPVAALAWLAGARRPCVACAVASGLVVLFGTEWTGVARRPDAAGGLRLEAARRAGRALRVVSWNVAGQVLLDDLASLAPDLCLFQENATPTAAQRSDPRWSQYTWIAGDDPAAWSRFPVHVLPTEPIGPWRAPLVLRVDKPGAPFLAFCVRLALPAVVVAAASPGDLANLADLRDAHAKRVGQFPRLAALVERTRRDQHLETAVLCGDFNSPAGLPSAEPLRRTLRDVWPVAGVGWGATMGADLPLTRIDQCWVSGDVDVVEAQVVRGGGSDHRMVLTDLILPRSSDVLGNSAHFHMPNPAAWSGGRPDTFVFRTLRLIVGSLRVRTSLSCGRLGHNLV